MISASDLRVGVTLLLEGEIHRVLEFERTHLGRGRANIRLKLRNIKTGATIERVFSPTERFEEVRLELRLVQYLYNDGSLYYFMDTQTYEQPALSAEALREQAKYLKEGLTLHLSMNEGQPVEVILPTTVDLAVAQTEPWVRGDTATAATKPATLETGLTIQVPLFVNRGDVVRVDTRIGEYVTRA